MSIGTKPTLIEVKPLKFIIMDAPRPNNLHVYLKEMKKHHVSHVARMCEPTYSVQELQQAGILVHEMEYKDGTSPPPEIITAWLKLVDETFFKNGNADACVAVHCVAGLGRAPVMVALALIEFANMDPVEAVSMIRERRRGAINEKQLLYLEGYKRSYKRSANGGGAEAGCCVVM